MPNRTLNALDVAVSDLPALRLGGPDEVAAAWGIVPDCTVANFVDHGREVSLDFDDFMPFPPDLLDQPTLTNIWMNEHWGTSNTVMTRLIEHGDGRALVLFCCDGGNDGQPSPALMREIVSGLKRPWRFESRHETEDFREVVLDLDGNEIEVPSWELFALTYQNEDGHDISRQEWEELRVRGENVFTHAEIRPELTR